MLCVHWKICSGYIKKKKINQLWGLCLFKKSKFSERSWQPMMNLVDWPEWKENHETTSSAENLKT